ncbi:MAG: phosphate/phosphite/phosphonate ABC transporter substrate-binding protein [Campylobacterales bacterium]|nr:phosphate/phosphite/phosphonate ABC transporter substrate-binding protein [Campylobacterales bacterium]
MKIGKKFTSACQKITMALLCLFVPSFMSAGPNITLGLTGTVFKDDLDNFMKLEQYLEENTPLGVSVIFSKTYAQMISLIENKTVDVAYVCNSTYTKLEQNKTGKLLVIPIVAGVDQYYSYTIVKKEAPFAKLDDFKDKIFAFTDPDSNSGSIAPKYYLYTNGFGVEGFFHRSIYTFEHGESIKAVLEGFVDGASVDSIVYHTFMEKYPEAKGKLKVIQILGPFANSPIAVRQGLSEEVFEKLQKTLSTMHLNKKGREILAKMGLDRFDVPSTQNYEPVRVMIEYLEQR